MADFIYIDGDEYRLDENLRKMIKEYLEKNSPNKFDRAHHGGRYFFIGDAGTIINTNDVNYKLDFARYAIGNYCQDKDILEKQARKEILLRKMWRFSMEHGGDKINWNSDDDKKWYLSLSFDNDAVVDFSYGYYPCGTVCFISEEVAKEALKFFKKEIKEVYGA